jgi:hypothetical protein
MKKIIFALTFAAALIIAFNGVSAEARRVAVMPLAIKEDGGIEVVLPVIADEKHSEAATKANALLAAMVMDRMADYKEFTEDMDGKKTFQSSYAVKYNENSLVSIVVSGYEYTGGAHGISWRESLTFDLETGKAFKLGDLFKSGADYKKVIDERIAYEIDRRDWQDSVRFEGISADTSFYLTEEALVIYYQPYEIAAYVFGLPSFAFDRYELSELFAEEIQSKI